MDVVDSIRAARRLNPTGGKARLAAFVAVPIVVGMLSACTATRSGTTFTAPRTVDTSQAMIMPAPGGPAVISLIEERFSDGVEQKVILATDATNSGQNYLAVRMYGPMERETQGAKSLGYRNFTAVAMTNEAIRAMPGVSMRQSDLFLRNNYGPFSYAFGQSSGGDSCIYGWQQLRSTEAERENFRNTGKIQIRLRLCENGASEKELLAVMYGYTVTGGFQSEQWNPYGRPKQVPLGGEPIYPQDAELAQPARTVTVKPVRRRPVVVQTRDDEAIEKQNLEDENAAKQLLDVPAPGADTTSDSDAQPAGNTTDSGVLVPGPE